MVSAEELKEVNDLERNDQALSHIVSTMFNQYGRLHKRSPTEALQDLQELNRALDESLDLTERITDPRVSELIATHRKYVQQISPMIEEMIKNRTHINLNWGRTRFEREFPKEVLIKLIPKNFKKILTILRLPKHSEPYIFSLKFENGKGDDLINELTAIENTAELSRREEGGGVWAGAAGPLVFDPVIIVTLISVVANIATLSDVLRKYLKKEEKSVNHPQVTIKTPKGEVILNNLPSSEIDKIMESVKEMMNVEE